MAEATAPVHPESATGGPGAQAPEEVKPDQPKFKVKVKRPRQRACDERNESETLPVKSKVCCGHLKRWYDYPKEVEALVGKHTEVYRCEICKTIYTADPRELPRSYTHRS